jgi:hypothetical protein
LKKEKITPQKALKSASIWARAAAKPPPKRDQPRRRRGWLSEPPHLQIQSSLRSILLCILKIVRTHFAAFSGGGQNSEKLIGKSACIEELK